MFLTISTTYRPATDLGYLLHKHPDRSQSFPVAGGTAQVFYPEADQERCTAALLLEVDPVALVRGTRGSAGEGFSLSQYVNDRPYAASSLLAVALAKVFGSAMKGRCDTRPELAATPIPLELRVPALPCRGGAGLAVRLFEPLGWRVHATPIPLDAKFPEWGMSRYVDLHLDGTLRLADALSHLYVLLPVLDDAKHYWVSNDEVDKLIRAGAGWLADHPDRELITRRYLAHQRRYADEALTRLAELDDRPAQDLEAEPVEPAAGHDAADERIPTLAETRRETILAALAEAGARRVVDLGCGEGKLLQALLSDPSYTEVVGVDVSPRTLQVAARRLDRLADRQKARVKLLQGALTYADSRLAGYDAAVLSEVIEHLDPPRLPALERATFGVARPRTVVVTTPNAEYNVRWNSLPAGTRRHPDHRFEWNRHEFTAWVEQVCARYDYSATLRGVGPDDAEVGAPTQMAVFTGNGGDK